MKYLQYAKAIIQMDRPHLHRFNNNPFYSQVALMRFMYLSDWLHTLRHNEPMTSLSWHKVPGGIYSPVLADILKKQAVPENLFMPLFLSASPTPYFQSISSPLSDKNYSLSTQEEDTISAVEYFIIEHSLAKVATSIVQTYPYFRENNYGSLNLVESVEELFNDNKKGNTQYMRSYLQYTDPLVDFFKIQK